MEKRENRMVKKHTSGTARKKVREVRFNKAVRVLKEELHYLKGDKVSLVWNSDMHVLYIESLDCTEKVIVPLENIIFMIIGGKKVAGGAIEISEEAGE